MPPFDSATTVGFPGAPAAAPGAQIRNLFSGTVLRARSTSGITDDSVVSGAGYYKVLMSAAVSRAMDTDWFAGAQLIVDDGTTELRYDLDPLINAQRVRDFVANPNVNLQSIRGVLAEQDGDGRLIVRAQAVGAYAGPDASAMAGNNFALFFGNGNVQTTKRVSDVGTGTGGGGGGGGTGDGDTPVDQNTGGVDARRVLLPGGAGADNVRIVAYLKSEYVLGDRTRRGTTYTGPDGRWLDPLNLNQGVEYILLYQIPGYTNVFVDDLTVP